MGKTFKDRNPYAKELRDRRYYNRIIPGKRYEDEDERRWRRYKEVDDWEDSEVGHQLDDD